MVQFSKPSAAHLVADEIPLYAEPDRRSTTDIVVQTPTLPNDQDQGDDVSVHRTRAHIKTNFTKLSALNNPFHGMSAGFWICCQSGSINNFALAPERCSVCGHGRCQTCR